MQNAKGKQFIVSLLVSNHAGVLTRVSSLFYRRSFNIDSLTVGETEDPALSRMTIVSWGDDYMKEQIVKQLQKLVDVKKVQLMDLDRTVVRELMIVKVRIMKGELSEVMEAVNTFRASIVDLSPESVCVEVTGETAKLDAFLEYMRQYKIVEMCRTGPTAMGRGNYCLENKQEFFVTAMENHLVR
ncbi:MAG: acetolactate synthase small subunit [Oscillospiraceae bacterium]